MIENALFHNVLCCAIEEKQKITYSYEVVWLPSDIRWASRWDIYLTMSDVQIHWFSLVNSIVVVFFLAGVLVFILKSYCSVLLE